MISLTDVITTAPDIVSRLVDEETVIVLPERGQIKVLNGVGSRIWTLADGERTLGDIVQSICREYDVSSVRAEADVLAFVEGLIQDDVISILSA